MKTAAIIFFVLAGLGTFAAINNVFLGGGSIRPTAGTSRHVGYAIGAFLFPLTMLIVGLILFDKSKKRRV